MLLLLSVSETGSELHVDSGVDTTHAKERVGTIFFFQLEPGGSLPVAREMHVPELTDVSSYQLWEMMNIACCSGWT